MGLAGEPDRLSGSLFSFSMGVLGAGCMGQKRQSSNHLDHEELLAEHHKWLSCRVMRSSKSLAG